MQGRTRLAMKNGVNYAVVEDMEYVYDAVENREFATLMSVTGQEAFSPEPLVIRCSEVAAMQAISEESWIWQQRAAELHYARQLQETTSAERQAAAAERLAASMEGHAG